MGEAEFNQCVRLSNQLVTAAENFGREEKVSPLLIATMPKHMDEQLKRAHKVVDVVDRTNRKICSTLLRYNVDQPESSYTQVISNAKKKKQEKFQKIVYVKKKPE